MDLALACTQISMRFEDWAMAHPNFLTRFWNLGSFDHRLERHPPHFLSVASSVKSLTSCSGSGLIPSLHMSSITIPSWPKVDVDREKALRLKNVLEVREERCPSSTEQGTAWLDPVDAIAEEGGLTKFHGKEKLRSSIPADQFCPACVIFLSTTNLQEEQNCIDGMSYGIMEPRLVKLKSATLKEQVTETTKMYHSDFAAMQKSSNLGCHLCCLIERAVSRKVSSLSSSPLLADDLYRKQVEIKPLSGVHLSITKDANRPILLWIWIRSDAAQGPRFQPISTLSVYGNDEVSDSSFEHIVRQRGFLRGSTSTQKSLDHINQWSKSCLESHSLCKPPRHQEGYHLPTRLIDLRGLHHKFPSDGIVALAKASDVERNEVYVTLSHRWGSRRLMVLDDKTESSLTKGITIDHFPILFQDVFRLVCDLGISYIWIDSLSIKQDDAADWEREASRMTSVYSSSFLNIVAGYASHHEHLFSSRNPLALTPCILSPSPLAQLMDIFAICDPENARPADRIRAMPTDSRGWILQECLLATRTIYFGDGMLIWRCNTKTETEESACMLHIPRNPFEQHDWKKVAMAHLETVDDQHLDRWLFQIWHEILKEYTGRHVTKASDRLIALAGVAESLHLKGRGTLGKYCAGLWETCFERQLCWSSQAYNPGPSHPDTKPSINDGISIRYPTTYVAPSWSWASLLNRTHNVLTDGGHGPWYTFLEDLQINVLYSGNAFGRVRGGHFLATANLCRAQVDPKSNPPTLLVSISSDGGKLDLVNLQSLNRFEALSLEELESLSLYMMPLLVVVEGHDDDSAKYVKPLNRSVLTNWRLDTEDEGFPGQPVITPSQPEHEASTARYHLIALILARANNGRGEYRRIGYQKCSKRTYIMHLRQACKMSDLSQDHYLERYSERCAYRIKVI